MAVAVRLIEDDPVPMNESVLNAVKLPLFFSVRVEVGEMDDVIIFEVDTEIVEIDVGEFDVEIDSQADIEILSDGVEVDDCDIDASIDIDEAGEGLMYELDEPELTYDADCEYIDE